MSSDTGPFPRTPLLVAGALIAGSLVLTGYRSWVNPAVQVVASAAPVVSARALRFEDAKTGQVVVVDDSTGSTIEVLDVGTNGFLRSTLRGLARARASAAGGAGDEAPFIVEQRADGQILLIDPVINRVIDLRAFGPANAHVFAKYLDRQDEYDIPKEARL